MHYSQINQYITETQQSLHHSETDLLYLENKIGQASNNVSALLGLVDNNIESMKSEANKLKITIINMTNTLNQLKEIQTKLDEPNGSDRDLTENETLEVYHIVEHSRRFQRLPINLQTLSNYEKYKASRRYVPGSVSLIQHFISLPDRFQTQAVFSALLRDDNLKKDRRNLIYNVFDALGTLPKTQQTESNFAAFCEATTESLRAKIVFSKMPASLREHLDYTETGEKLQGDNLATMEAFIHLPECLQTVKNANLVTIPSPNAAQHLTAIRLFLEKTPHAQRVIHKDPEAEPITETELENLPSFYQTIFNRMIHMDLKTIQDLTNQWDRLQKETNTPENVLAFLEFQETGMKHMSHRYRHPNNVSAPWKMQTQRFLSPLRFDMLVILDKLDSLPKTALNNGLNKEIAEALKEILTNINPIVGIGGENREEKLKVVASITRTITTEFHHYLTQKNDVTTFARNIQTLLSNPKNKKTIETHASLLHRVVRGLIEVIQTLFFGYGFYNNHIRRHGYGNTNTQASLSRVSACAKQLERQKQENKSERCSAI